MKENEYYETNDMVLAGTLALAYPIELIDKSDPRKVRFSFKRDDGLDGYIEEFWKGQIRVEPLSFFNSIKTIKSRIYEQ